MAWQFRCNGKFAKRKVVNKKLKAMAGMSAAKQRKKEEKSKTNGSENSELTNETYNGTRIIDVDELAKNLKCCQCESILSLQNTKNERRFGLTSVFDILCEDCRVMNQVSTSKFHYTKKGAKHADITSKMVLGAVHAGIGCTALNKVLVCADIPPMNYSSFKKYEREVGPEIENIAKESCRRAAQAERRLVIEKIDELYEELPEEIRKEIFPHLSLLRSSMNSDEGHDSNGNIDVLNNNEEQTDDNNRQQVDEVVKSVVNILVSYDMGWSRRGNGKSYDSLNGYGAIVGFLSGKVLDFASRNRGCKKCDHGHNKEDHDCRLNHTGSAKAMEPSVGAQLVNESTILKETGVNARVVIGDDDSHTIAEIRRGNPLQIFKLSDTNHLRKRFVGDLFSLKPKFKEMRRKETIPHLKKCFGYAIKQNKGNTTQIAFALRNIPHHVFGHHENCGEWCHRAESEENAKGQIILQDQDLFHAIQEIFDKYASKATKFSMAASSQSNESLNNIIAHKAPKNCCYSLSESCDYRLASGVAAKNEGEKYLLDVQKNLFTNSGKITATFANRQKRIHDRRVTLAKLPAVKRRRNLLTHQRKNRRKTNETSEGVQYQPNCDINVNTEESILNVNSESIIDQLPSTQISVENCNLLFFDLETSGLSSTADILQIAGKLEEEEFSVYVKPSQQIDSHASDVTGLKNIDGNLFYRGVQVECVSIQEALTQFQRFLDSSSKPCILVAHNARFDSSLLLQAIVRNSMVHKFNNIAGFSDTYVILKRLFPDRRGQGAFKLSELARDLLKINDCANFHEAMFDVKILEKLTSSFITKENLVANCKPFKECVVMKIMSPHLNSLKKIVSAPIVKKIAMAGLKLDALKKCYVEHGREGVIQILSQKGPDNKVIVTKNKKVLSKILEFIATYNN